MDDYAHAPHRRRPPHNEETRVCVWTHSYTNNTWNQGGNVRNPMIESTLKMDTHINPSASNVAADVMMFFPRPGRYTWGTIWHRSSWGWTKFCKKICIKSRSDHGEDDPGRQVKHQGKQPDQLLRLPYTNRVGYWRKRTEKSILCYIFTFLIQNIKYPPHKYSIIMTFNGIEEPRCVESLPFTFTLFVGRTQAYYAVPLLSLSYLLTSGQLDRE